MEAIFEKLGWKKFSVIVVIITIIFLIMLFLSFQNSDRTISEQNTSPINEDEKNFDGSLGGGTDNQNAFEYSNDYYSILYPVRFSVVELIASPPILHNLELVDDITSNRIQVVVFDREGNTVDSLSPPYQNDNFEVKIVEQNGMYGYQFEGGFDENHHQKVVLIQKGHSIIRFNLSYSGEKDEELEMAFDAIVESLN